mmetsp:Transcript_23425/g.59975  ORF Transcript_23425/g.59975 Transcript_23425/m.59975 type:complete len:286 (-) Transcript_23425:37-894(-)
MSVHTIQSTPAPMNTSHACKWQNLTKALPSTLSGHNGQPVLPFLDSCHSHDMPSLTPPPPRIAGIHSQCAFALNLSTCLLLPTWAWPQSKPCCHGPCQNLSALASCHDQQAHHIPGHRPRCASPRAPSYPPPATDASSACRCVLRRSCGPGRCQVRMQPPWSALMTSPSLNSTSDMGSRCTLCCMMGCTMFMSAWGTEGVMLPGPAAAAAAGRPTLGLRACSEWPGATLPVSLALLRAGDARLALLLDFLMALATTGIANRSPSSGWICTSQKHICASCPTDARR